MYRSTSTSTPSRPSATSTSTSSSDAIPSGLSHSHSLPALPSITSPQRPSLPSTPSTQHLQSPQTPASSSKNKNFHPYLIQTTSSSLLSRTNSSPAQPLYEGGGRHRVSRSMSALNKPEGIVERQYSGSECGSEDGNALTQEKGSSVVGKGVRVGMKRSGTLPSYPSMESLKEKVKVKEMELPNDPKTWTASELAQYLSKTLRKGGSSDERDQTLPGPLIDDIKSWILRHQVTGRAFLKGPETWTTSSRPPPFLPLLTSISRKLRRSSIHSRISNTSNPTVEDGGDGFGASSVLVEEDEDGDFQPLESAHGTRVIGVKGMAQAYDAIHSSASEASGDEGPLRQQNTGEQHRREVWKRWEAEMRPRPLRRQDTGSSMGSVDEVMLAAARGQSHVQSIEDVQSTDDEEIDQGGTIKPSKLLSLGTTTVVPVELTSSSSSNGTSPPSAYLSSSPDKSRLSTQNETGTPSPSLLTPIKHEGGRSASHSVTPTPDPQRTANDVNDTTHSPTPHPNTNTNTNSKARQSLGRSVSRKLPKHLQEQGTETDDEYDQDEEHYSAARRVTIRPPGRISSRDIFNKSAPIKSERELELETELETVKTRLLELEGRLIDVESTTRPQSTPAPEKPTPAATPDITSLIFGKLGLIGKGEDGLPTTVKKLPAYLFLVGFGVGAVFVRVLFSRSR